MTALKASCQNQEKQMGTVISMYESDYDGILLPPQWLDRWYKLGTPYAQGLLVRYNPNNKKTDSATPLCPDDPASNGIHGKIHV